MWIQAEKIPTYRLEKDMTRQELAEKIGLSVQALKKIELGMNGTKIDTLVELADFFHTSLDFLVCGVERYADTGVDVFCQQLSEKELLFVRRLVKNTIENMVLFK